MNAIERELTVARQVQDSLSLAITSLDCSHATVRVYQRRFDILGGDWVGVRLDKSGQLFLAIADVTGKGIPAAMVAQTIHSLWALALTEDKFDPIQWINQVNSTLIKLGHSAPHTATIRPRSKRRPSSGPSQRRRRPTFDLGRAQDRNK